MKTVSKNINRRSLFFLHFNPNLHKIFIFDYNYILDSLQNINSQKKKLVRSALYCATVALFYEITCMEVRHY